LLSSFSCSAIALKAHQELTQGTACDVISINTNPVSA
jgi:hypothetical protein